MYIRKIKITNIKGIDKFEMDFSEVSKAGWHVLIGDNGSGKSTILRCLGIALLESTESQAITLYNGFAAKNWLRNSESEGTIIWWPEKGQDFNSSGLSESSPLIASFNIHQIEWVSGREPYDDVVAKTFCSGYGPFRRLSGKNDSIFQNGTRSCFATLFSEEEGMLATQAWLNSLKLGSDSEPEKLSELNFVVQFINDSELLPDGAKLTNRFGTEGIKIKDASGNEIYFRDASDGYRSILSLALDLVKNLIAHYGIQNVMENASANQIDLPGVVLIDEVDAHLHPNWQVRIGNWFTDFFPAIQFIVTTHSPLICRGCQEKGQIWHLKTPGSGEESAHVTPLQRKRLVYGDVLDAYDTEVFGRNVASSENSVSLRQKLAELNMKSILGTISEEENKELQDLKSYL